MGHRIKTCIKCGVVKTKSTCGERVGKNGKRYFKSYCSKCENKIQSSRYWVKKNKKPVIVESLAGEIWLPVVGNNRYMVSNLGRVKALPHKRAFSEINLKPHKNKKGYLYARLRPSIKSIHGLVARAFIPNPLDYPMVNHKNGIKTDNRVENLEWADNSLNQKHAYALGLASAKGMKARRRILTDDQVKFIIESPDTSINLSRFYKVHKSTISKIRTRKNWSSI